MEKDPHGEHGQTMVEFGIIVSALFIVTIFSVGVGLNFYRYNSLSAAARYAGRWASVVGGTCLQSQISTTNADWCNQLTANSRSNFWGTSGNSPKQVGGNCLNNDGSVISGNFYQASQFTGSTSTTIVGSVVQHFDSSNNSPNFIVGAFTPAFDMKKLLVCIQLQGVGTPSLVLPGDSVKVYVAYPFDGNLGIGNFIAPTLTASAQFVVE